MQLPLRTHGTLTTALSHDTYSTTKLEIQVIASKYLNFTPKFSIYFCNINSSYSKNVNHYNFNEFIFVITKHLAFGTSSQLHCKDFHVNEL